MSPPSPPPKRWLRRLTAAALLLAAQLQPLGAQTLQELLPRVVPTHPRLQAAIANARSLGYEVEQAAAAWEPRYGAIVDPGLSSRKPAGGSNIAGDVALRATKLIADGGKADAETRRQQARTNAARQRVGLALEQVTAQLADAYLECLKQQTLVGEAHKNVRQHEELVSRVGEIVEIDRGRRSELDQARARLVQARVTLATRQSGLIEARMQLSALAQGPVIAISAVAPVTSDLPDSEEGALRLLDSHPAIKAAQGDIEAAREAAAIADAWRHPRVDLQGTVMGDTGPGGNRRFLNTLDLRIVSNWVGFDGGASESAAQAARQQMNAALQTQEATRRDLAVELSRHWSTIQTRKSRTAAWQDLVKELEVVRANYWEQFRIGRRSVLDLLNVENEIYQARNSAQTDAAEEAQAEFRLLGALGRLGTVFHIPGASQP